MKKFLKMLGRGVNMKNKKQKFRILMPFIKFSKMLERWPPLPASPWFCLWLEHLPVGTSRFLKSHKSIDEFQHNYVYWTKFMVVILKKMSVPDAFGQVLEHQLGKISWFGNENT